MRYLIRSAAVGATLLASACGSERSELVPLVSEALTDLVTPDAPQPDLRAQLTPEVLAGIDGPLIIVEVPSAPSQAGLGLAGTNGPYVTWAAENSTLVITNRGVLTGSRGLGFDLMNADVAGTLAALSAGGGTSTRVHRYLDGVGNVIAREFSCTVRATGEDLVRLVSATLEAATFTEVCSGELGGSFENRYWVAGGSGIVKSRQWLSPEIGYLLIERAK